MRILIAEDDQVLADGLLRSMSATGYAGGPGAAAAKPMPVVVTSSTC